MVPQLLIFAGTQVLNFTTMDGDSYQIQDGTSSTRVSKISDPDKPTSYVDNQAIQQNKKLGYLIRNKADEVVANIRNLRPKRNT